MNRLLSCLVAASTTSFLCFAALVATLMRRQFVCVAAILWVSFVDEARSANSPLMPADLLIANLHRPDGVFQFRGNNLVQTMSSPAISGVRGASPTSDGKIASTWERDTGNTGIAVFDPTTGGVMLFNTPQTTLPCDVSVTLSGDYVVNDQWGSDIDIYSSTGSFIRTLTLPPMSGERAPGGNAVAPDGTIWITMARRQDILHYDATGTFLGSFLPGFNPGDIVVDSADGTLWFPDIESNRVHHFSTAGVPIFSFETAIPARSQSFLGIAMTGNGWLYVASPASQNVYLYRQDGELLGDFPLPVSPTYINFISSTVPEPSTLLPLAISAISLLGRRKRS